MALKRGMNGSSEIGQHGTALLAACMDDGLEVGGEHIAALAATAVAALAPQDEAAQLALGVVVGRVDVAIVDEAPQRSAVLEDVLARAGDAGRGCALLEEPFDDLSKVPGPLAKLAAGHGPVAHAMPVVEHHLRPQEELVAELAGLAAARREGGELPQQVSPADLPLRHRPEAELRATVGGEHAAHPRHPFLQRRLGAVGGDHEHRHRGGGHGPQAAVGAGARPRRRVDVLDPVAQRVKACFVDRRRDRVAHDLLGLAERTQRHPDPQQMVQEPLRLAPADVAVGDHEPDQREHAGAEEAGRGPGRRRAARGDATRALDVVAIELRHRRFDLRQVDDLPDQRLAVARLGQRRVAAPTCRGEAVLPGGDLVQRQQLAPMSLVARLASATLAARRWRGPLGTRARWIGRRRLARVRRVLAKLSLKRLDLSPQPRDLRVPGHDRRLLRIDLGEQSVDLAFQAFDPLVGRRHSSIRSRPIWLVDPRRSTTRRGNPDSDR